MLLRLLPVLVASASILPAAAAVAESAYSGPAANRCLDCHTASQQGFGPGHEFGDGGCIVCHAGDASATEESVAHAGMFAFPGLIGNAPRACGGCHADQVASVTGSLMHSGRGIVEVTRRIVGTAPDDPDVASLQSLGHGPADSMLRKLCANCHLGQPKTEHRLDTMDDRGGGCLACHVNHYADNRHPQLSRKIGDARCFGCHSRSGRISLNYVGLAEIDPDHVRARAAGPVLADGRDVERKPADIHYSAGMACIDCHTGFGLMGGDGAVEYQRDAVDIACTDCHFAAGQVPDNIQGRYLVTRKNGTPLKHIQLRPDGTWLRSKVTGRTIRIPALEPANHATDATHERLECSACHSQWAPQCFGCHMTYEPHDEQFDHVERAVTAGRWHETRSDFRNGLPTLGVNHEGRIEPFIPGMIMTLRHPDWNDGKFARLFAPLSPHTTGRSRSCESCHRSSVALGLGQGSLTRDDANWRFSASYPVLADGLPADAWTSIDGRAVGDAPLPGQRPLDPDEMKKILDALLPR